MALANEKNIHNNCMTFENFVNSMRGSAGEARNVVLEILNSPDASNRDKLVAAGMVMDRAYGKPGQKLEVSGPDGGPVEHSFTIEFVRPK